ncbi:MAG: NUDIX domain-containing protein [Anaerolinea sp.]|nr:NUDIX domain-containing protein [Anaerolinea sp.]
MMSYVDWIRARVGTRKIFLVYSSVVLLDEMGRVLLQRRADFDVWGLPGGVMEIEEDIVTCARRELQEESGLTAGELSLVGVYTHPKFDVTYPNGDQVQQFTVCLRGMVNGGQMQVDGVETREQAFFTWPPPDTLTIQHWYRAMLADALRGGPPAFTPPFANGRSQDQIAAIRPYVGDDRFIAVGASAVVVREDGRILMVQRRDNGNWVFPAGYSDLGENVAYTAVRETKEETGLDILPERILGVYSSPLFHHTYPNGHQIKDVGVTFRARLLGGAADTHVDEHEIADSAWLMPAEILQVTPAQYRPYFESALAHLHEGYFLL